MAPEGAIFSLFYHEAFDKCSSRGICVVFLDELAPPSFQVFFHFREVGPVVLLNFIAGDTHRVLFTIGRHAQRQPLNSFDLSEYPGGVDGEKLAELVACIEVVRRALWRFKDHLAA